MPRLPTERVREGLLHPDQEVRRAALHYFTHAFWPDPAVMATVIEAVVRYGRKDAFGYGIGGADLGQSAETVRWAAAELRAAPGTQDDFYLGSVGRLLAEADPGLVAPIADEVLGAPGLEREYAARIRRRLELRGKDGDELWADLDALCRAHAKTENGWEFPWEHGYDLADALGRQGDRHAPRMMERLAVAAAEDDTVGFWKEALAVRLAGELRHEPAVPLLVAKFEADAEILSEEAIRALARIGSDAAVAAALAAYPAAPWEVRLYLGGVFGDVRSAAALEAGMAAARGEEDDEQRSHLTVGVVGQLSTEGNDFARDYLADVGDDTEVLSILVPACALTGQDYPELPAWRAALAAPRRRLSPPEPPPAYRGPPPITRDDARVGRNDPCPCGSGKKFKKCCLPRGGDG